MCLGLMVGGVGQDEMERNMEITVQGLGSEAQATNSS